MRKPSQYKPAKIKLLVCPLRPEAPLFIISLPPPLGKHNRKRGSTQAQTLQTCPKRSEAFSICLFTALWITSERCFGVLYCSIWYCRCIFTPLVLACRHVIILCISICIQYIKYNSFLIEQDPETQGSISQRSLGSEMSWPQMHRPWWSWSRTSIQL